MQISIISSDKNNRLFVKNNSKYPTIIKNSNSLIEIIVNTDAIHRIKNILVVYIIFKLNNLDTSDLLSISHKAPIIQGRGLKKSIIINNKKIEYIDESYNASPETMKICIDYFNKIKIAKEQKKVLILGDMNELGKDSIKYHCEILKYIISYNLENVIICGELMKSALNKMNLTNSKIELMPNEKTILEYLNFLQNNDILLVKGSNSTMVNKLSKILLKKKEAN